ncbi:MAG: cation:proton antiporter, partial [Nitrososphaerota archaeon]|nr:cation:proton antiporter [Nitrososphaerota archaeon]
MTYPIIFNVLAILASAVVLGEIFEQAKIPHVVGELLSGIIVGPALLGVVNTSPELDAVSSVALFFIIFLIGLEMNTEMLRRSIPKSTLVSLTSFLIPLVPVFALAYLLFPFGSVSGFVMALAITVPSVSIVSVLVLRFKMIHTATGQIILSSVTVSDILAFLFLAVVSQSVGRTLYTVGYLGIFLAAFLAVDWLLNYSPSASRKVLARASGLLKREDVPYAMLIIAGMFMAWLMQAIGISYILGAFFAGLLVHEGLVGKKAFKKVTGTLETMNRAFFIPLFFGLAGIQVNLRGDNLFLFLALALLIAVDVASSMYLSYAAAKSLLKIREEGGPRRMAAIMGGRGSVGIIIATFSLGQGLINGTVYSLI